jgi:hypothetical protein
MTPREPIAALELQHSETAIVHAASRIFSALIAAGRLTDANAAELIRSSVRMAIALGVEVDRVLDSDAESGGTPGRLGPLG